MASYVIYTIHNGISYEQLKKPLQFTNDTLGLTNWILRFPLTIYSLDVQEKHIFSHDSVVIAANSALPLDEKWRYFVVTQQDGKRLYCTAQVYYERGWVNNCLRLNSNIVGEPQSEAQEFYLPRCIVVLSNQPYFKIHVNLLKIHRELRKSQPNISHTINPKSLSSYLNLKAEGRQHEWVNSEVVQPRRQPQIEIVMQYYLQKFNQHKFGEVILFQKSNNWPILHLYKLHRSSLFQFSHFFNLPISNQIIKSAIIAILLQKQLVVTSKSQNLNVMVIQSLLQLIRPLKWQHMLVHNLPSHLIEAASENFMPFIIGIHKKHLINFETEGKYLLVVDQNRFVMPQALPVINIGFQNFPNQLINASTPSHINQKLVLENSIQFMCKIMDPWLKRYDQNFQKNISFYNEFYDKTSLFIRFKELYQRGEMKQFQRLVLIRNTDRISQIRRRLNQTLHIVQNPRILNNQIAWVEFYLSKTQGAPIAPPKNTKDESRQLTLKEIKQNISRQNRGYINNVTRRMHEAKQRSYSNAEIFNRNSKSGQKLKISMVRSEKFHPLLAQLLEHKMGVSLPKKI